MSLSALRSPARSRQEVVELISFIGQGSEQLKRIHHEEAQAIASATAAATAKARPIETAMAEAQFKVVTWFQGNPGAAATVVGAEAFTGDPLDAHAVAVLLTSGRPLTDRQRKILAYLQDGYVLRRTGKLRSYSLLPSEPPFLSKDLVSSAHVFDLQARFLDAFDLKTGARLLGVAAHHNQAVEFRIKPDVVIP